VNHSEHSYYVIENQIPDPKIKLGQNDRENLETSDEYISNELLVNRSMVKE
jgi:hypothetical protein